jgi:hypothetical protein
MKLLIVVVGYDGDHLDSKKSQQNKRKGNSLQVVARGHWRYFLQCENGMCVSETVFRIKTLRGPQNQNVSRPPKSKRFEAPKIKTFRGPQNQNVSRPSKSKRFEAPKIKTFRGPQNQNASRPPIALILQGSFILVIKELGNAFTHARRQ